MIIFLIVLKIFDRWSTFLYVFEGVFIFLGVYTKLNSFQALRWIWQLSKAEALCELTRFFKLGYIFNFIVIYFIIYGVSACPFVGPNQSKKNTGVRIPVGCRSDAGRSPNHGVKWYRTCPGNIPEDIFNRSPTLI